MEEAHICPKCHSVLASGTTRCPYCGYDFAKADSRKKQKEKRRAEKDRRYNENRFHSQNDWLAFWMGIGSWIYIGLLFGPLAIYFGWRDFRHDNIATIGVVLGALGFLVSIAEAVLTVLVYLGLL